MSDQAPFKEAVLVSDSFSKIYEALAKAQGEFPVIEKNSRVDVYSKPPNRTLLYFYMYADLTEIINKTRPALSKHGLSFTQGMGSSGFYTKLMHSSGECFESGIIPTQIKANDYKEMAGAITYLKRISLSAALGISADEDVDAAESEAKQGNTTEKKNTKGNYDPNKSNPPKPQQEPKNHAPKSPKQKLIDLVKRENIAHEDVAEIIYRCTGNPDLKSDNLTNDQYNTIEQYIIMTKKSRGGQV